MTHTAFCLVVDYEFVVKIRKFKMGNAIWWTGIQNWYHAHHIESMPLKEIKFFFKSSQLKKKFSSWRIDYYTVSHVCFNYSTDAESGVSTLLGLNMRWLFFLEFIVEYISACNGTPVTKEFVPSGTMANYYSGSELQWLCEQAVNGINRERRGSRKSSEEWREANG